MTGNLHASMTRGVRDGQPIFKERRPLQVPKPRDSTGMRWLVECPRYSNDD